jgi:succinate dehydrogenase hydrophobic anchor subunit
MHIEKIEYGPVKKGFWSNVAFIAIILLTLIAATITGMVVLKIILSDPVEATSRGFVENIGILLASLMFIMGTIIYLHVKGLLQDEYVTTLE